MEEKVKKNKFTKVIRLEVDKPIGEDWPAFNKKMFELQKVYSDMLNDYCLNFFAEIKKRIDEVNEQGITLNKKSVKMTDIINFCNSEIATNYKDRYTSYAYSQAYRLMQLKMENEWQDIFIKKTKRFPFYRKDGPIHIKHERNIYGCGIEENNDDEKVKRLIWLSIFNNSSKTIVLLRNNSFKDYNLPIWERLLKGEYKYGMVSLIYKKSKRKWFVNISYTFDSIANEKLDPGIRVGVDLGVVFPVCMAVNSNHDRLFVKDDDIGLLRFRRQIEKRRKNLRRMERKIFDNRSGKGRKHKLSPLELLEDKYENFRRTANHRMSKWVINFAKRNNAGVIVLEALRENDKKQKYLKFNWIYHELQTMIKNKAEEAGIKVETVNPAYTSLCCSECGHIDKLNRPARDKFHCIKCGYQEHADYNAARNLANPEIETIIQKSSKKNKEDDNSLFA